MCPFIRLLLGDPEEKDKVKNAADCCRKILNHVNQAVKESENKQVITFTWLRCHSNFLYQASANISQEMGSLDSRQ